MESAKGEFIVFDDDDFGVPERIEVQIHHILNYEEQHKDVPVCCYASGERRYPNGYLLEIRAIGSQPVIPIGESVIDYLLFNGRRTNLFYGAGTPTCALMMRRSVLSDFGGFDENLRRVEDVDLAIRIGFGGGHFIGCPQNSITFSTSAQDKTPKKNFEAGLQIITKYQDYLQSKSLFIYAKLWNQLRYYHFSQNRSHLPRHLLNLFLVNPLRTLKHLWRSGPIRWWHERQMNSISDEIMVKVLKIFLPKGSGTTEEPAKAYCIQLSLASVEMGNHIGKTGEGYFGSSSNAAKRLVFNKRAVADITSERDWQLAFRGKVLIENAVAEHVFEHLTEEEAYRATRLIYDHLLPKGTLRIAVLTEIIQILFIDEIAV